MVVVLRMAKKCHPLYKSMGKLLTFGIFINSAIVQKNLKLGVVITWVISIVQKYMRCHSNMPCGSRPFDPGCGKHLYVQCIQTSRMSDYNAKIGRQSLPWNLLSKQARSRSRKFPGFSFRNSG